jgi:hypothetical protein
MENVDAPSIDGRPESLMPYNETTSKEDLFALLDFMEQHSIPVWVHGGWGLEALTGVARPHGDIDLLADEVHRDKLIEALGPKVVAKHLHKLEVNFNGAEVDLVFFSRKGDAAVTITPRIIARWSPGFISSGHKGTIDGREIPILSPRSLYVQISNPVRKKKEMLEKNARDLEQIKPFLREEEMREAQKYYPIENTFINRLRTQLGF